MRISWRTQVGLRGLLIQTDALWRAYAAVRPGHPLHGVSAETIPDRLLGRPLVHAGPCCADGVCHVLGPPGVDDEAWWFGVRPDERFSPREVDGEPAPEPHDLWWLGFDCPLAWSQERAHKRVEWLARQLARAVT